MHKNKETTLSKWEKGQVSKTHTYLLCLFAHNSYFVKAKISADNILLTQHTHHADLDRGAPHGDLARQQGQE